MEAINELMGSLSNYFVGNKARIYCLCGLILGLFRVRTVNLQELATAFPSDAKMSSRYRRLQRFFAWFKFDYALVARWCFSLFFAGTSQQIYITIDRTNWYFGKSKVNIFMLAVAYEGIAIPLFWKRLPKAGNSTGEEPIELLTLFIETFGKERIQGILADREFANKQVINWLVSNDIPFYYRIKSNSQVRIFNGKKVSIEKVFNALNPKEQFAYVNHVELFGKQLRVAGARSEAGDLMIVLTNRTPNNAISIYLRRWEIESLFQSLKGRGFRFEETHITHLERIKKLTALLSIAFCWAHKAGEWRAQNKPIRMCKHRDNLRPQNSYFRYGFDWLRDTLFNIKTRNKQMSKLIKQLLSPDIVAFNSSGEQIV